MDWFEEKYSLYPKEKKCMNCKKRKKPEEFYKGVTPSGLSTWCKECQKTESRNVYWPNRAKKLWTNRQS